MQTEGMCSHCNTVYSLENGKLPAHDMQRASDPAGTCQGGGKVPASLVVNNELVPNPVAWQSK